MGFWWRSVTKERSMPITRRPHRPLSLGLGVLVLLLAGCQSAPLRGGGPPPPPFTWVATAAPSATAQQALAVSLRYLRLCATGPAAAITTTWVVTGPTYGLAVLVADCHTDPRDQPQGLPFPQLGVAPPDQPPSP